MMRIKRLLLNGLCLSILFCVWPMMALAGVINLPQTGQTTCYDNDGNVISCTGTGQDGDVRAGVPWPEPRFVDNGDGTITDHLTGLIWLKNATCFMVRTWTDALSVSNSLASGSCGLTDGSVAGDWRLPNIVELESLVNIEVSHPFTWLIFQGFTGEQFPGPLAYFYWSGSTDAFDTSFTQIVGMDDGYVSARHKTTGDSFDPVWPVRGGKVITDATVDVQPAKTWRTGQIVSYATGDDGALQTGTAWPEPRFSDNGDGTVTDHLTGLIWLKNADCFGPLSWDNALNVSNSLASGSCGLSDGSLAGDWRLPNRKEFFSLIDFSRHGPALANGHPFINVPSTGGAASRYWSASTYAATGPNMHHQQAWAPSVENGDVYGYLKEESVYSGSVWPVRDGDGGGGGGGDGPIVANDCSDIAGNWQGNWSETACDNASYSGTWTATVSNDCSFTGTTNWNHVSGTIDPNTQVLTATGTDYGGCGTISVTGTFANDSVSGSYTYSIGGGGTFSGNLDSGLSTDTSSGDSGGGGGCFIGTVFSIW